MIDYKKISQKLLKIHNIISGRNDTIDDLKEKYIDDSLTIVQQQLSDSEAKSSPSKSPEATSDSCERCRTFFA